MLSLVPFPFETAEGDIRAEGTLGAALAAALLSGCQVGLRLTTYDCLCCDWGTPHVIGTFSHRNRFLIRANHGRNVESSDNSRSGHMEEFGTRSLDVSEID